MPYDPLKELKRVTDYYNGDPLQKRFSALVTGETNAGKTFLLRTARQPVHIDSFDPGGTKCLSDLIRCKSNPDGQIIADTSFENEDPFNPKVFAKWMKDIDIRLQTGYFEHFGTLCLDSLTSFEKAVIGFGMGNRAGEAPQHRKDYNPAKVYIENYIRKLMNLPCDLIITAHLRKESKLLSVDSSSGIRYEEITYRLYTIGQAVVTVPLLFDEVYVLRGKGSPPKRYIVTDALGEFIARSRLKRNGKLEAEEPPDIKALLKKAGFSHEDKPRLPKEVSEKNV
ncbi:MAG: ATP-binding protein [Gammaproteobacteria bacterium]|nr:ATP-binding protein [Gammaproteobacteria bacterium]